MRSTVVIVDDHATFRSLARAVLEASGFDVVGEAVDGASAIERARRLRPAVVLLDIHVSEVVAVETFEQLLFRRITQLAGGVKANVAHGVKENLVATTHLRRLTGSSRTSEDVVGIEVDPLRPLGLDPDAVELPPSYASEA